MKILKREEEKDEEKLKEVKSDRLMKLALLCNTQPFPSLVPWMLCSCPYQSCIAA